ncbi:MAG: hypothetical protein IPL10_15360 [Bacteroidetes bacterium]|nr:hypothetical protein [Bacteroidota bacterium]
MWILKISDDKRIQKTIATANEPFVKEPTGIGKVNTFSALFCDGNTHGQYDYRCHQMEI